MDINKNLFQWSIYFFDQKFSGSFASPGAGAKSKTKPNHKLADEWHEPVTEKSKKM